MFYDTNKNQLFCGTCLYKKLCQENEVMLAREFCQQKLAEWESIIQRMNEFHQ